MRRDFIEQLVDLAERDERIMLLTGDLGYTVIEPFADRFPDRFYNVGVAEQNMIGVATGLAEAGYVPFAWSIATFASMRPYEFIRNGPALHELAVRIVGIGGAFEYGHNGVTHYALEDVAILRAQPSVCVIAPADHVQTRNALEASADVKGPVYFRLGKQTVEIPGLDGRFRLGRLERLRDGPDVALIAMGGIAAEAVAAADLLAQSGIEARVGIVSSCNPSPSEDIADFLAGVRLAVTVEAHYTVGGIGSLVSEVIAERGIGCRLVRCGVETMPRGSTGSEPYLLDLHGLSAQALARTATQSLQLVAS